MSKKSPFLSVVIPAYNEEGYINRCLDSLMKQDLDKNDYEIIVVDNASSDKTVKIVHKYPVKLLSEPKRSVVQARQKGLEASRGKYYVSADADTIYPPKWLSTIKKTFEKNPQLVGIVGWIYFLNSPTFFNIFFAENQELNLIIGKLLGKFPLMFAANFAVKKSSLIKIEGYPIHLPELGDQQYILFKLFKEGKIIIKKEVYCFTSSRRHQYIFKDMVIHNGWYRIFGFFVNTILGKKLIGPAPAIREEVKKP